MAETEEGGWSGTSGRAQGIPGQSFLVAAGEFADGRRHRRRDWDHALAGTFMHELGHTLGLAHGGWDGGQYNVTYKPNYLSVMNYYYQFSGLFGHGVDTMNYSTSKLADLDEKHLDEFTGVGSAGVLGGLGVEWTCRGDDPTKKTERIIPGERGAGSGINFNCKNDLESGYTESDINGDNEETLLTGSDDWANLVFAGGAIGAMGLAAPDPPMVTEAEDELTIDQALATDTLGNPGQGALTISGPYTVVAGESGQNLFAGVDNLSWSPGEWTISATGDLLESDFTSDIAVEGSNADAVTSQSLGIPLVDDPQPGSYVVEVVLAGESGEQGRLEVPIEVVAMDEDQRQQLLDAAQAGELEMDPLVTDQYVEVLQAQVTLDGNGGEPASQTIGAVDDGSVLLPDGPTRDGHTFLGWNTMADGTGTMHSPGDTVAIEESLTLYAVWEEVVAPIVTHAVSYDANGGTGSVVDATRYEVGESATVAANTFTRDGYRFVSWNTALDGGGTPYAPGDALVMADDITLYAQWTEIVVPPDDSPTSQPTIPDPPTLESPSSEGPSVPPASASTPPSQVGAVKAPTGGVVGSADSSMPGVIAVVLGIAMLAAGGAALRLRRQH